MVVAVMVVDVMLVSGGRGGGGPFLSFYSLVDRRKRGSYVTRQCENK